MKLEVGKWYLDGMNNKYLVLKTDGPKPDYPVVAMTEEGTPLSRGPLGNIYPNNKSNFDFVAEYKPPRVIYVNEYNNDIGDLAYNTAEQATQKAGYGASGVKRAAVKYMEVVE